MAFKPNPGFRPASRLDSIVAAFCGVQRIFSRTCEEEPDGIVNGDDVTIVGANLNAGGTGEWFLGDFDYDGICDGDDVTVLGALYDPTAPPLSAEYLTEKYGAEFAAAFEAGRTMAPEPSMLGILAITLALRRRRAR